MPWAEKLKSCDTCTALDFVGGREASEEDTEWIEGSPPAVPKTSCPSSVILSTVP